MIPSSHEQIARLQRDKIIFAVESVAASMVGLLITVAIPLLQTILPVSTLIIISGLAIFGPILYWIYVVVGNVSRFKKIKELEKQELTTEPKKKPRG
jgi:short subunit fatty acids transporter